MRLLIIDPQNDFHDMEGSALPVTGAMEDAKRLSKLIQKLVEKGKDTPINQIAVTMDTHQEYDIAHKAFWVNDKGEQPDPFTVISNEDILNGVWKPEDPSMFDYVKEYTRYVEENDKEPLLIWPNHCIKGTYGWEVQDDIKEALKAWQWVTGDKVEYYEKGTNNKTEHFGAFVPEMELNEDNAKFDKAFFDKFIENTSEQIVVGGQALTHCVGESIRQILDKTKRPASDFVLLVDTTSPVPGFEEKGEKLIKEFKEKGVKVMTTKKYINSLQQKKGMKNNI